MKTGGTSPKNNKNIEKTLKKLQIGRGTPYATIVIFIILHILATVLIILSSRSDIVITLNGASVPLQAFTGVFSSIANACTIFMVVFYYKVGFIVSMVILFIQFPSIIVNVFVLHSSSSIPGFFTNLFTIVSVVIIHVSNTKIEKYQKKIRDQAVTDGLTGLPNRFAGNELVGDLVKQGKRFAVVSVDLNNFKSINETMGQSTGNAVLIEIASRWKNLADSGSTGTVDFVTRQSGDEFSLIIRGYYSDNELGKTLRSYQDALEAKITADECDFFLTASFGYAEYPADADSGDALFAYADVAMNEVKRANSSDRVLHFTPGLLKLEHTLDIEREIREALVNDTIFFNLQPQFDMSHKLRGFEALARMKNAEGSIISPGEFIPVAEKVGLIDKVDSTVFRKSACFVGELIRRTNADITLSVNVSVRHLMKNGFMKELREIIENAGIKPEHLEIEITESVMIDSAEKALDRIKEIKNMGIMIAIDDFGTGYSSLSYLHNFPADLLKIDKSFIDKMGAGESSKQYVASIISIGHIMGFDVISEGVEENDQLETLRNIKCDFIQGFIWGRPLPQEEAEKLVLSQLAS